MSTLGACVPYVCLPGRCHCRLLEKWNAVLGWNAPGLELGIGRCLHFLSFFSFFLSFFLVSSMGFWIDICNSGAGNCSVYRQGSLVPESSSSSLLPTSSWRLSAHFGFLFLSCFGGSVPPLWGPASEGKGASRLWLRPENVLALLPWGSLRVRRQEAGRRESSWRGHVF